MVMTISHEDGIEWENYYFGLLRNEKNRRLLHYYIIHFENLFQNGKSYQKVLDVLKNSKHKINVEENEGKNRLLVKIKGRYYNMVRELGIANLEFKKGLDLFIYDEIDLNESRRIAVENLTLMVSNSANGELSLGDKKIIRDIALATFHSSLEKAVNGFSEEVADLESCVRTDLHDWPANQLISYGFKVKHPRFYEIA